MLAPVLALAALVALPPAVGVAASALANAGTVHVYRFAAGARTPVLRGGGAPVLAPRYGQRVTLVGRLGFYPSGRGLRGAVVQVVSPTRSVAAAALTDRRGRFVVRWRARENGPYSVAAVGFPSSARAVTVRLRPRVQVGRARRRARIGASILIRGRVLPRFSGAFLGTTYLQVYQRPSGGWLTRANAPIGPDGGFALRYRVRAGGARTLAMRVITPRTASGWSAGTSRLITLRVR